MIAKRASARVRRQKSIGTKRIRHPRYCGWVRRAAALVVLVSVIVFAVLMRAAMASYPGGTWLDPRAEGHDFWLNFFCDLLHDVSLGGRANEAGAAYARAGMLVLVCGLLAFFWIVP